MKLTEREIFNRARAWFSAEQMEVIQVVPPGGQAAVSLTLRGGDRLRTVVPDVLVAKGTSLWVGEMKSGFSVADAQKLKDILGDEAARTQLYRLADRRLAGYFLDPPSLVGVLLHSDVRRIPVPDLAQWIFGPESCVFLPPADVSESG